jgi:hypothetical protein
MYLVVSMRRIVAWDATDKKFSQAEDERRYVRQCTSAAGIFSLLKAEPLAMLSTKINGSIKCRGKIRLLITHVSST